MGRKAIKRLVVALAFEDGAVVAEIARRREVRAQQIHGWRREAREGRLALPAEDPHQGCKAHDAHEDRKILIGQARVVFLIIALALVAASQRQSSWRCRSALIALWVGRGSSPRLAGLLPVAFV